jgi:MFS family permease
LVYGIIEAGRLSWTERSVILWLGVGVIMLVLFAVSELRSDHPMLPMRFFKNMSFTGATIPMAMVLMAGGAIMFFLSQYFQSVRGYSPMQTALMMLPGPAMTFLTATAAAPLANAIGTKFTVSLGLFVSGIGLFLLSLLTPGTQWYALVGASIIQGAGFGLAFSPAANSIMGSLPVKKAGIGSALDNTVQQIGYVLGVAALGAVLNAVYRDRVADLQVVVSLPQEAREAILSSIQGANVVAGEFPSDISQQIVQGSSEAFTSGVERALIIGVAIMIIAVLFTLIVLPSRIRRPEE